MHLLCHNMLRKCHCTMEAGCPAYQHSTLSMLSHLFCKACPCSMAGLFVSLQSGPKSVVGLYNCSSYIDLCCGPDLYVLEMCLQRPSCQSEVEGLSRPKRHSSFLLLFCKRKQQQELLMEAACGYPLSVSLFTSQTLQPWPTLIFVVAEEAASGC